MTSGGLKYNFKTDTKSAWQVTTLMTINTKLSYLLIFFCIFIIYISITLSYKKCYNPVVIQNGYSKGDLLIVPLIGRGDIAILNKKGCVTKKLSTSKNTFYGEFNKDGDIVLIHIHKNLNNNTLSKNQIYGSTGLINIYDRHSMKIKNFYQDDTLHHDIAIQDSNNLFALSWFVKDYNTKNGTVKIVEDSAVQINLQDQKIVNRWTFSNYLSVSAGLDYVSANGEDKLYDLFHANSIDYTSKNPINGNPAILITFRHFKNGSIILIDIKLNKILWKSSYKKLFTFPHDASFTNTGTITFFSNGNFTAFLSKNPSKHKQASLTMSRIVDYDIKNEKVIWEYGQDLSFFDKYSLFSPLISGVQKTKKGYLITSGMQGQIVEISKDKQLVWKLPAAASFLKDTRDAPAVALFKVRQY